MDISAPPGAASAAVMDKRVHARKSFFFKIHEKWFCEDVAHDGARISGVMGFLQIFCADGAVLCSERIRLFTRSKRLQVPYSGDARRFASPPHGNRKNHRLFDGLWVSLLGVPRSAEFN